MLFSELREFADLTSRQKSFNTRTGGLGQVLVFVFDLPSKKSSLQKIFGSNLTLQAREARGVPRNQWFSLAHAKENLNNSDLNSLLVRAERVVA